MTMEWASDTIRQQDGVLPQQVTGLGHSAPPYLKRLRNRNCVIKYFNYPAFLITIGVYLLGSLSCRKADEQRQLATVKVEAQNSHPPPNEIQRPIILAHYEIKPSSLPPPLTTPSVNYPPFVVPKPEGGGLTLPPSFHIDTFADGLENPRWMSVAANGDVFVAESNSGRLTILRGVNKHGRADQRFVFTTGLSQPFGMAFWRQYLYVANTNGVVRFKYHPGQEQSAGEPEKIVDLPGQGYNQHWTRNLIFSPDGSQMYVTVGSETNAEPESNPLRAAISRYSPDGSGHRIYASGLRNPVGLAFYPGTRTLWAAVQERDGLGDDLVPDYVTSIKEGGFYGWPYFYAGQNEDPGHKGMRPDLMQKTILGDVLIQSHSAVLGLLFYEGNMFPNDYRNNAFVALHGSWNRSKRTGYKIIRIRFKNGKPVGGYDDFIVGWMSNESRAEVWGRPVGLVVLKDGSMLIADDGAQKIWRVTYSKQE
jgi:glucose/arabinose dehydrogenase